jgi:CRP-like cAMP-binding protein
LRFYQKSSEESEITNRTVSDFSKLVVGIKTRLRRLFLVSPKMVRSIALHAARNIQLANEKSLKSLIFKDVVLVDKLADLCSSGQREKGRPLNR